MQGRLKVQNAQYPPGVRAQLAEVPCDLKETPAAGDAIYMKGLVERLARKQAASKDSVQTRCVLETL